MTSIPVEIKKGDIVLAKAISIKSNMVIADVFHVIRKNRPISGSRDGTIRVSELSRSYVKDPATEYSPGDIIRAKITQVKPSLQLSTKDRDLGVIKAVCNKCRHPLDLSGNRLECKNCNNSERRKIAIDYGNYDLHKL